MQERKPPLPQGLKGGSSHSQLDKYERLPGGSDMGTRLELRCNVGIKNGSGHTWRGDEHRTCKSRVMAAFVEIQLSSSKAVLRK